MIKNSYNPKVPALDLEMNALIRWNSRLFSLGTDRCAQWWKEGGK
jgi:hypothetical protein